eukprot:PhF_6_TR41334/c0_g1_i1/m.62690
MSSLPQITSTGNYGNGRNTGGKSSIVIKKPIMGLSMPIEKPKPLRHRRRTLIAVPKDPPPVLNESDLRRGILSCMERGLIPNTFDVSAAMSGETGLGVLSVEAAPIYKFSDQFKPQQVLTTEFGFAPLCNVKLDLVAIERMDPNPPAPIQKQDPEPTAPAPLPIVVPDANAKDREDTRTYTELLDQYSLHEFIIRKGSTLANTPEFVSYRRSFQHCWGPIMDLVKQLEKLLTEYDIPLAYIDGKRLATLARTDMGLASVQDLLGLISNRDEVQSIIEQPARRYQQGKTGHQLAAVKIQSIARMYLARRAFKHLRVCMFAAQIIQRQWRIHRYHKSTKKMIDDQHEELIRVWRATMDKFVRNWNRIKEGKRLIIHLPSLSYNEKQCSSIPFFNCYQNAQLTRLCDLADPNVEIVYIAPFQIEPEALQYYVKMAQAGGVADAESRFVVLVPENAKRLPLTISLTRAVLFSQRTMRRLTSIVRGRVAYIVPGVVSREEIILAAKLNIPLLGGDDKVCRVLGSKSGMKTICEAADVVTPVGAHDLMEERELYVVLARLISQYPEYPRWMVKLDHEFGGRGLAYLDVRKLHCMEMEKTVSKDKLTELIHNELKEQSSKRMKIVNLNVYPDWVAFMKDFETFGGCVEAVPASVLSSPTANLFIEPNGTVHVVSIQEQVLAPQYCSLGSQSPQTVLPHVALRDAALSIGAALYQKKVMGYASIDFVSFRKGAQGQLRLWVVDLDLQLTHTAAAHHLFNFVTASFYDHETGKNLYETENGELVPLSYTYSGLIYHPYIGGLRHSVFFNMCKQKGLSYDVTNRTGVIFHLVDTLLRGCIGVLCVASTEAESVQLHTEAVEFIQQQLTMASMCVEENETNFNFVSTAAKNLYQKVLLEKRNAKDKKNRKSSVMDGSAEDNNGNSDQMPQIRTDQETVD